MDCKPRDFDSIIFDLDGTLWDTTDACARGFNEVVDRNKIPFRKVTSEDIKKVTGKPHAECIETICDGLEDKYIDLLIEETSIHDTLSIKNQGGHLFNGVKEELRNLAKHYKLFIVSNCQSGYIEAFYETMGLKNYFLDFECWGRTNRSKTDNAKDVIERNGLIKPLFVGDTSGDELAAREAKIPFVHVAYGFGKPMFPSISFDTFHEFSAWLLNKTTVDESSFYFKDAKDIDSEKLSELAMRSKSYWPYSPDFLSQTRSLLKINKEYIDRWPVVISVNKKTNEYLGFFSLKEVGEENRLDHLWVEPKYLQLGLGSKLFNESINRARELKWKSFRIAAEPYSLPFYEKMGAVMIGKIKSSIKPSLEVPHLEYFFD